MQQAIDIFEVGLRDGLQSLNACIPTAAKITMANQLSGLGFSGLELGAFVDPKRVPAMADSERLCREARKISGISYRAFTPNRRGIDMAADTGIDCAGIAIAASTTFNERNIGKTTDKVLQSVTALQNAAHEQSMDFMVCIATAIHCPFEGYIQPEQVYGLVDALQALDCQLVLGETLGKATPQETETLLNYLHSKGSNCTTLGAHFHDTFNRGLDNYHVCLQAGITRFDTSFAGLGGCPFAPGAAGNVASEAFADFLLQNGYSCNIDLAALRVVGQQFCQQHQLPCQAKSGAHHE